MLTPQPRKICLPLKSNFHVITQLNFTWSLFLYHFNFNFIIFVHKEYANFHFNRCSVFTECCFWLWKRFEWSKSLLVRFPLHCPTGEDSPLPINAIQIIGWLVTSKHQKSGTKKAAFAAYLIHLILNICINRCSY